jgi:hypothetical protein
MTLVERGTMKNSKVQALLDHYEAGLISSDELIRLLKEHLSNKEE